MSYTEDDIFTLASKLGAIDLTEGEQAVLDALVDAAHGEVEGFAQPPLSFAPLKPAEFLQVRHDTAKAMITSTNVMGSAEGNNI